MAITASWFGKGLQHVMEGDVDLSADVINVALFTNAFTPAIDTDEFFNALANEVAAGGGYTAGGEALANQATSYVAADDAAEFDADDVVWAASTITAAYAVIYVDGATPGTDDYLLGWVDFDGDKSSSSGDFTITWDANGILRLTAA